MRNYPELPNISITVAVCFLLLAAACSQPEPAATETVAPVQTATVKRAVIQRIIRARGILHPVDQAIVTAKISAPVREFFVNRGDHVRKGQLLAQLENSDLAAAALEAQGAVDQAEASYRSTTAASLPEEIARAQSEVQSTRAALDAAEKVYESRKLLLEQGALPRRQVDEAHVAFIQAQSQHQNALKHLDSLERIGKDTEVKQAQAQLDATRGRRQGAQVQLEYSRILSPLDGVVTERPMYAGEMASPGVPLLTVMNLSRVIARANVPSGQLRFLKAGDPATITSPDSFGAVQGKVTVVSPALDPNSTTAEVWIEAVNPGERLRPGVSVEVAILAETVPDAIVIPFTAILPSEEGAGMVLIVDADSVAHPREIETGIREGDRVQVLKGLEPGEQVIVEGGLGLENNTKVHVENPGDQPEKKSNQETDKHDGNS